MENTKLCKDKVLYALEQYNNKATSEQKKLDLDELEKECISTVDAYEYVNDLATNKKRKKKMIRLLSTILFINSMPVLGFSVIPYVAMIKSKRKYRYILIGLFFAVLGALGIYGAVTLKSNIY